MSTQVTNYQCPACTGPLHFVGESGKLECDFCGSKFTVEEIEAFYAAKDEEATEAFEEAEAKAAEEAAEAEENIEDSQWDMSELNDDWGEDGEKMKAYHCPSCGAELICEATTAATACPYCGNPSIVPGQFGGTLKPDLVIPFKLNKDAAIAALKNHYKGKFLLPKEFKDKNHLEEMKGIYVPFWLYDATVETDCTFHGRRSRTYVAGGYEVTEIDHYDARRTGTVVFENIPADGSKKMADDYMDSIEPFDYSELKPFSTAYLPGYLADRYDVSAAQSAVRADNRCKETAIDSMSADVTGYDDVSRKRCDLNIHRGKVRYALLPVWTLRTKWRGKEYLFMMNGQTGKLVGDMPVDKKKAKQTTVGLTVLFTLLLMLTGIGSKIGMLIVYLISRGCVL